MDCAILYMKSTRKTGLLSLLAFKKHYVGWPFSETERTVITFRMIFTFFAVFCLFPVTPIQVKPLTTKVTSFLSLKQSPRTKPLSPDKTLADP